MAISKLILNGEVQMDVTSNTNAANNMLNGVVGTKNDGTSVTGNIASKSSTDLTISGATVTAPAGYYANAASKAVATTTHPNPTAAIVSSTGVVTATHTQTTGYVTSGTTTGTLNLTTQGATTYNTSTADQTIASNRWLTGAQTIKGVTTSNLTAENIAEGIIVKVGDANNASRITQITGTHSGGKKYYATITGTGNVGCCAIYPNSTGTRYYQDGDKFEISEGSVIYLKAVGNLSTGFIYVNDIQVAGSQSGVTYSYTVPSNTDVEISLSAGSSATLRLTEVVASLDIYENGTYNVSEYDFANVNVVLDDGYTIDQIAMRSISGNISGNASIIGAYAFASCLRLTTVSFPVCTSIGSSAFNYCSSLATVSFPVCTTIGNAAFYSCRSLTTVNFPSCTTISIYAFASCPRLTTANFPSCTTIGSSAFNYCYSLATVSFPVCTTIGSFAFYSCSGLTTVSFPSCTTIDGSAFYSCRSLTTVNFPSCTRIGNGAFSHCTGLTTVSFPVCTSIGSSAFADCTGLTTVNFPSCTTISGYAFTYCTGLTTVSFPSCTKIYGAAFSDCHNLLSVYLLGSSIPSLVNTNAFNLTPIAGYTTSTGGVYGSIYVPASLYDSYLTATYWSAFSSRFVSV